jgi:hypothetical protein
MFFTKNLWYVAYRSGCLRRYGLKFDASPNKGFAAAFMPKHRFHRKRGQGAAFSRQKRGWSVAWCVFCL